ncbi:MAG: NUDIX domain-containing protein [Bacteroidota bacterium]|nr:NUDIX domain-containing protein [Bacteroidota bacterium]
MERIKEPNKGLMSPPGGKLNIHEAESPANCAVREAFEECLINSKEHDWKLKGIVTEKNYPQAGNLMIFLMEYKIFLDDLPPPCNEGEFCFIHPDEFKNYNLPITDKQFIWNNYLQNNSEVFIITLDCSDYPDIKQVKLKF